MQNILIIQTAFIGDVILATPLIEAIHNHNSEIKIDFLLRKGNESLFKGHPHLNNVLIWTKKSNKYSNLFKLLNQIRARKYDVVINVQRFGGTGFLTAFSNAKIKIGFNNNPFSFGFTHKINHSVNKGFHETERNLQLLGPLFETKVVKPALYPTQDNFDAVKPYQTSSYICTAPTSVWFTKQYPKEKWVDFFNNINSNLSIYLLGGPADFKDCQNILNESTNKNLVNLAGKLSMLESAALMKSAKMNFVNDSAPMHMASSVNAPTTAIFCSTVPAFGFGPLSSNSKIVEIEKALSCRPCGLHGKRTCPKKHFKCAYDINTNNLIERI